MKDLALDSAPNMTTCPGFVRDGRREEVPVVLYMRRVLRLWYGDPDRPDTEEVKMQAGCSRWRTCENLDCEFAQAARRTNWQSGG